MIADSTADRLPLAVAAARRRRIRRRRGLALVVSVAALLIALMVSLSVGSSSMGASRSWELLLHPDGSQESTVIHELRVPRTVVAVAVGASLALAGALMQAMTRNPLADPGVLGVNAGASLAVVLGVTWGLAVGIEQYLWFAFAGAAVAAVGVQVLAGTARQSASPARLALAGVTVSAALAAITETVTLLDQRAFNEFRFWAAGSLEGRGFDVLQVVAPFMVVGLVLAVLLGPALNVLSLGEDGAKALGARPGLVRGASLLAVTLLAGAATAAAGPIGFVGLAVPMLARALVGHDHRWVAWLCVVLGPVWLLFADALARVVLGEQETQVGIIAALVGAPLFVAVVRRGKVASL